MKPDRMVEQRRTVARAILIQCGIAPHERFESLSRGQITRLTKWARSNRYQVPRGHNKEGLALNYHASLRRQALMVAV